jgi:hypothetical protein
VSMGRVVVGSVVADLMRKALLAGHSLYSDPRLALGKKTTVRPGGETSTES